MAGVSGVTGLSVPSHAVGGFEPEGESVTVQVQKGRGAIVRVWELKSKAVTLTTVQVRLFVVCRM